MWLMTPRGFFSTVQHREYPSLVLVRARCREDLENLCELGENHPGMIGVDSKAILETKISDYPFRLIVSARAWQMLVSLMAEEITYANFKSAVHAVNDQRASTYMSVWSALHRIQDEKPKTLWDKMREKFPSRRDEERWLSEQVELLLDDIAASGKEQSPAIPTDDGDELMDRLAAAVEQIEVYDQNEDVDLYDDDPIDFEDYYGVEGHRPDETDERP